jgi:hypothetical protein
MPKWPDRPASRPTQPTCGPPPFSVFTKRLYLAPFEAMAAGDILDPGDWDREPGDVPLLKITSVMHHTPCVVAVLSWNYFCRSPLSASTSSQLGGPLSSQISDTAMSAPMSGPIT